MHQLLPHWKKKKKKTVMNVRFNVRFRSTYLKNFYVLSAFIKSSNGSYGILKIFAEEKDRVDQLEGI